MLPAISSRSAASIRPSVRRTTVRHVAALAVAMFGAACGSDSAGVVIPDTGVSVVLNASRVSLVAGQTRQLIATVTGGSNLEVTWTSATPAVASVSSTGVVTAVTAGETSITATSRADPNKNASTTIVVAFRVNVLLAPSAGDVTVGGTNPAGGNATLQLLATVTGDANTAVTYTSSAPTIASVNASGVVTAVAAGTATITASSVAEPTRGAASVIFVFPAVSGILTISGQAIPDVSGATASERLYRIIVPAGATSLVVTTAGGTGDLDFFVRRGIPPTTSSPRACASVGPNTNESCTIASPAAGNWYIVLAGFEAYRGVTFTATVAP